LSIINLNLIFAYTCVTEIVLVIYGAGQLIEVLLLTPTFAVLVPLILP
jgi:hypothetical protein